MSEPITFFSESFQNRTTYYDVHENGMLYRPDSDEKISFLWRDIQYIEDRSGDRIDIILNNLKEVPIKYTTNEFPVFLKTICLRLSDVRKEKFSFQKFPLTSKYLFHLSIAVFLLVLSLIISLPVSNALFFLFLTLAIPLGIFFQRQPISLTLDDHCLTFHHLHKNTAVNYHEIVNIDFEVLNNDYGSTLGILIHLQDRKDITIKKLEDIIIFFIMLQIKLNENIKVC
jgi:hypothetical protein